MKKILFDIIEQFDIHEFINIIKSDPFYLVENILISSILCLTMYWFITTKKYGFYFFFAYFFFFVLKANLKEKFNDAHFSVYCAYFFYLLTLHILWQNFTAMIPEVITITAFLLLPAHISFTFFIGTFFMALEQTKFTLPRGFLPDGVPIVVGPFLYVIEFISYFIRLFSLAIRLFINILAGHILLKIFAVSVLLLCSFSIELYLVQLILGLVELIFVFIEYAACFLQSIVLVSLVAIYTDHSLNFYHKVKD